VQGWRDDEARGGRDPAGDALAAREDARLLRETYSDEREELEGPRQRTARRMQAGLFEQLESRPPSQAAETEATPPSLTLGHLCPILNL
jgi:hypothetical protein